MLSFCVCSRNPRQRGRESRLCGFDGLTRVAKKVGTLGLVDDLKKLEELAPRGEKRG